MPRAWANFPLVAWPVLGHGALEVLRVADWAAREFAVAPPFAVGGNSLGGDIDVAAAGLDPRIAYARYFYDRIDPLTNVASYAHRPALAFECGAIDERVPPDGARRFVTALADVYGDAAASRLQDTLHPDVGHETVPAMMENCLDWLRRHAQAAVGFVDLGSDAAVQSRQGAGSLVRTA